MPPNPLSKFLGFELEGEAPADPAPAEPREVDPYRVPPRTGPAPIGRGPTKAEYDATEPAALARIRLEANLRTIMQAEGIHMAMTAAQKALSNICREARETGRGHGFIG